MSAWLSPLKWLAIATLIFGLVFTAAPGRADSGQTVDLKEESTCLSCHESLYYLYDTGKWFCVAKAPMACVNCHGGDPTATDQTAAHQHLETHPVINGDATTCQQCHPEDCAERVQQFDRMAGISQNIRVAVSTQPQAAAAPQPIVQSSAFAFDPVIVLWSLGGVAVLVIGLSVFGYLRHR
jgi:cytochrome c553